MAARCGQGRGRCAATWPASPLVGRGGTVRATLPPTGSLPPPKTARRTATTHCPHTVERRAPLSPAALRRRDERSSSLAGGAMSRMPCATRCPVSRPLFQAASGSSASSAYGMGLAPTTVPDLPGDARRTVPHAIGAPGVPPAHRTAAARPGRAGGRGSMGGASAARGHARVRAVLRTCRHRRQNRNDHVEPG